MLAGSYPGGALPNPLPITALTQHAHGSLRLLSTYFLLGGSSLVNIIAFTDRGGPCISEKLSDLPEATQAGTDQCPGLADPRALTVWGGSNMPTAVPSLNVKESELGPRERGDGDKTMKLSEGTNMGQSSEGF